MDFCELHIKFTGWSGIGREREEHTCLGIIQIAHQQFLVCRKVEVTQHTVTSVEPDPDFVAHAERGSFHVNYLEDVEGHVSPGLTV